MAQGNPLLSQRSGRGARRVLWRAGTNGTEADTRCELMASNRNEGAYKRDSAVRESRDQRPEIFGVGRPSNVCQLQGCRHFQGTSSPKVSSEADVDDAMHAVFLKCRGKELRNCLSDTRRSRGHLGLQSCLGEFRRAGLEQHCRAQVEGRSTGLGEPLVHDR